MMTDNWQALRALRKTEDVADEIDAIPDCPGVYMIFGDATDLLEGTGYETMESRDPFQVAGIDLLYIGSSMNLRTRLSCHFKDDSRVSSFRMSIGCLLREKLDLTVNPHLTKTYFHFGAGEPRLTRWLFQNTAMAIWPCDQCQDLEKALIRNLPAPLNITDRRAHPYSRYLLDLRSRANGRHGRPRRYPNWVRHPSSFRKARRQAAVE